MNTVIKFFKTVLQWRKFEYSVITPKIWMRHQIFVNKSTGYFGVFCTLYDKNFIISLNIIYIDVKDYIIFT